MKEAKKLIKSIEQYYEKLINTSVDNVWQSASKNYSNQYAENISIFSSSYTQRGEALFSLTLMSLVSKAENIGISTGNTEKDF